MQMQQKSKLVTLLLCWFFGSLGIHRFYVGKVGTGLLYLFTGGFFGIGVFIDLIKLLCNTFTDKNMIPLNNDVPTILIIIALICWGVIVLFLNIFGLIGKMIGAILAG